MNLIFRPVLENILYLNQNGIPTQCSGSTVHLRPKLFAAVFDLPGRSAATNTKHFNGEFGCFYCLDKGEIYNRAHIYPPTAEHKLRTTNELRRWALEAERTGQAQYGFKGISVLAAQPKWPCTQVQEVQDLAGFLHMHEWLKTNLQNCCKSFHVQEWLMTTLQVAVRISNVNSWKKALLARI